MIRKRKKFEWPKKLWDKPRILDENKLKLKYGLKNKKEIWKTDAKVKYFRNRAKSLITAEAEEQQIFFDKLNRVGLNIKTVADVLSLDKEDLMKRRLASIVCEKGLADTPKQARQMIVHKRILVGGNVVNIPSYLVKVEEEKNIILKKKVKKVKPVEGPVEEVSEKSESSEIVEEKVETKTEEGEIENA
tara:strand:+ start:49 stop:615 length:567 start_codon:yes stop_codon:yes gene_type:complete